MKEADKFRPALFAFAMLVASCAPAVALDPSLNVSQYAHTAWKIRDGFTKGLIQSIAQTPDSYLWLGTEFGLLRFDGVRVTPWEPPRGEQLPSNHIMRLLVSRDGTLWIGTAKGLASWKEGKLTLYPNLSDAVGMIFEDRQGTIWLGAYSPGRICAMEGRKLRCEGAGRLGTGVWNLYEDGNSNLWAVAETGLWRWKPGLSQRYELPEGNGEINDVIEGDGGELLLATSHGLKQLVSGRMQTYLLPDVSWQFRPTDFLRSADGDLWIGTTRGLLHRHQGKTDTFSQLDGLSGNFIGGFFQDREGTLWVATFGGLDRFRDYAATVLSLEPGLLGESGYSVQSTPDGSIWAATPQGLTRWNAGRVTTYRAPESQRSDDAEERRDLSSRSSSSEMLNSGLPGNPGSLGVDDVGNLWASSFAGVVRFEANRFLAVRGVPRGVVFSMVSDRRGGVWISDQSHGLFHLIENQAVEQFPWTKLVGRQDPALALQSDSSGASGSDFRPVVWRTSKTAKSSKDTQPRMDWGMAICGNCE